jgi:UDP-3-O-[3-hydroxymyristoyl] glucosamine N-acyltransferase
MSEEINVAEAYDKGRALFMGIELQWRFSLLGNERRMLGCCSFLLAALLERRDEHQCLGRVVGVAALFYPMPPVSPGIHSSAIVAEGALVDPSAEVGPLSVIETGAEIGPGCRIGPCAVIGSGVIVGRDCRIGAHVSLSYAVLGARVYVYPGARIGQEGFGFASIKDGFQSVPQLGRVILEDDVEVGANTTIDRGSSRDTVIGAGSRLDNLVQIGHNVILGRCCVIVAQVGISGSTILEDFVRVGGQAAMAGHLRIGQSAEIGAQSGVISDIAPGAKVLGSPAQPKRDFFREIATLKQMAKKEG